MTISSYNLTSDPWQVINVILGSYNCEINLYQRRTGLFFDLKANNVDIVMGKRVFTMRYIVRAAYKFPYDFFLFNPVFDGKTMPKAADLADNYMLCADTEPNYQASKYAGILVTG